MILYKLSNIGLLTIILLFPFGCFGYECLRNAIRKKTVIKIIDIVLIIVAIFGILKFSVLGRKASGVHLISFWGNDLSSNDFWKEMELNILLYIPLGSTIVHYINKVWKIVCISFLISIHVELWQYYYGTGFGQVTDVICNTLGAFIGVLGYILFMKYSKKHRRGLIMAGKLQRQVLVSMIWRFGERFLAQIVTFVVSVVLARLLAPSDYGNVALLMIFIELADAFVVHGFASALVQKQDVDNVDFSSVFYFSIFVTILIYIMIFFAAPVLEYCFKSPELPNLFRVLALRIPLSGINSVQHAYVQCNMLFKRFFFATLGGTLSSAILGIVLAYNGAGAWALIAQYLGNSLCDTLILWITVKWRPSKEFSWKRLKQLLDFGSKMLGSQLLHVIYNRLSSFIIGTVYTTADLAFYEQGSKIPGIVETNIDTTINSVLFPAMSKSQDNIERLKMMVRKSIRISAMLVWPLMIGLLVMSSKIIMLVYTEKWMPCVIFMQIACIRLAMEPIQTANLQAIKALGRSDLYIKLELMKKMYGLVVLLISARISIVAIALGALSQAIFSFIMNAIPNRKLLKYSIFEQLQDVVPSACLSVIMGIFVWEMGIVLPNKEIIMVLQVMMGAILYIALTIIFRKKDYLYVLDILRSLFMS